MISHLSIRSAVLITLQLGGVRRVPPVDCVDCRCITEYLPDLLLPTLHPSSTWTAITTQMEVCTWVARRCLLFVVKILLSLTSHGFTSTRGKFRTSLTTHVRGESLNLETERNRTCTAIAVETEPNRSRTST
jgi:hypothetical protein